MNQFKPKGLEDILADSFKENDFFAEEAPKQVSQAPVQPPVQDQSYTNLENLSLIPGSVGAAPMQNIGAYGSEIKSVFKQLEAVNIESKELKIFENKDK